MKFLLILFLSTTLFGQAYNDTGAVKIPSWVETDNALLRAKARKKYNATLTIGGGYYAYSYPSNMVDDADAMTEQYVLSSGEICGSVSIYEEAPDVFHYKSQVRKQDELRWTTKEAAEDDVVGKCSPIQTIYASPWGNNCYVTTPYFTPAPSVLVPNSGSYQ